MSEQFNPNQLATFEEAVSLSKEIPASCGGGVTSIYIPKWGGPFPIPEDGDKKFYHFGFANGMDGVNVGLVRESKQRNPNWVEMLSLEVNAYQPPAEQ
jgi:hypothetical protein